MSKTEVSIIIPAYNEAESIGRLVEKTRALYPDFEIIVIDANSSDRTLACLKHYPQGRIHVHSVASYHVYDMLNWGISLNRPVYYYRERNW